MTLPVRRRVRGMFFSFVLLCGGITRSDGGSSSSSLDGSENIDMTEKKTKKKRETRIPIAGYWPDYRPMENLNQSASMLSDLILFSLELDTDGTVGGDGTCCLQSHHYEKARQAKDQLVVDEEKKDMNLWISIGGAGRSHHWNQVCSNPTKRTKFIQSVEDLCHREKIQGVSIDWFSAMSTVQDLEVFSECFRLASQRWRRKRKRNSSSSSETSVGGDLQISLSYYPMQIHPTVVFPWVDRIQIMTYGLSSLPQQQHQRGSTTLSDLVATQTEQAIQTLIHQGGCPTNKIWLGIPFYAQAIRTDTQRRNPVLTYGDAMASFQSMKDGDEDDSDGDEDSMLIRIRNHLHQTLDGGYQWESEEIMKIKMDLVRKYSLGGVFIWELGQDAISTTFPAGIALTQLYRLSQEDPSEGTSTIPPPFATTDAAQQNNIKNEL